MSTTPRKFPIRITYILSNVTDAIAFEWIAAHLNRQLFQLDFILLVQHQEPIWLEQQLHNQNVPYVRFNFRSKKDYPRLIWNIWKQLRANQTEIVHTHIFEANVCGLLAALLAGISRRIYTRHHSTLNFLYYPWAVRYDKWINRLATDIVAITSSVKSVLVNRENADPNKIRVIHHCFDTNHFSCVSDDRIQAIRDKYRLSADIFVVGVVSRYTKMKGVEYMIDAFAKFLERGYATKLVLANARGSHKPVIDQHLAQLPKDSYIEIEFERDIPALYKCMSVFLHTPIDCDSEAYGQTYVEAMLAKIPSIITISGIANDYAKHGENCWVVGYQNAEDIYQALEKLYHEPELAKRISDNAFELAVQKFSLDKMIGDLEQLYLKQ
ncbi:MAG: glycosyltransferase family 4 protein [Bacteroidia bacterium]|nr:glycosyltransferase family 4 protein [Bacteroidia bacterium]